MKRPLAYILAAAAGGALLGSYLLARKLRPALVLAAEVLEQAALSAGSCACAEMSLLLRAKVSCARCNDWMTRPMTDNELATVSGFGARPGSAEPLPDALLRHLAEMSYHEFPRPL